MKATLVGALAMTCAATLPAAAQAPLTGFWVRDSIECTPQGARCGYATTGSGAWSSWSLQLAIDVQRQAVIVSGPGEYPMMQHVDTFFVDGRFTHWLPGRRGIARDSSSKGDSYAPAPSVSRHLWDGESWRLSADARTLTHELAWTSPANATERIVMIYRRSAR
jgi:hypothetical protein